MNTLAKSYNMIASAIEKTNQINSNYKTFADSTLSSFYILTRNVNELIFDAQPHKNDMSTKIWLETYIDLENEIRLVDVIDKYRDSFFMSITCSDELQNFYTDYPDIVEFLSTFD